MSLENRMGKYDGELQMFSQSSRDPEIRYLQVLRRMVELGRLEHAVAGPPTGEYAEFTQAILNNQPPGMYKLDRRPRVRYSWVQ